MIHFQTPQVCHCAEISSDRLHVLHWIRLWNTNREHISISRRTEEGREKIQEKVCVSVVPASQVESSTAALVSSSSFLPCSPVSLLSFCSRFSSLILSSSPRLFVPLCAALSCPLIPPRCYPSALLFSPSFIPVSDVSCSVSTVPDTSHHHTAIFLRSFSLPH